MKNKFFKSILILAFVFIGFTVQAEDTIPPIDPVTLDTVPPVIVLNGESSIDLYVSGSYVEAGATASDDVDGDITISIVVEGVVDTMTPGVYNINYNVADSSLNQAVTVSRTITIKEIPKASIHLVVEADSGSLYNGDIDVTACTPEQSATLAISAYCALSQSGLTVGWNWWGDDAFLNEVNGVANNSNENGVYWGWFSNSELGQVALNKYILNDGDYIVLNYNINPLRVVSDKTNLVVGNQINFTAQSFGYDSFWNPAWTPVDGAIINVNGSNFQTNSEGNVTYSATSEGVLFLKATKSGFIDSEEIKITINAAPQEGGGGIVFVPKTFSILNANNFLLNNQNQNGSFGSALYTDWVAISAKISNAPFLTVLKNYLLNNPLDSSLATDNERHAMALMALDINPYNGTNTNYISKIIKEFDGNQIGDKILDNDDIFGLIVLNKVGYSYSDDIISKTINFVKNKQSSDGSWDNNPDMTSAAIMSLYPFKNKDGVSDSIDKAFNYLTLGQSTDGSIGGNISSTSWMIQALTLDPKFSSSLDRARNYLALHQENDGGVGDIGSDIDSRVWATSYAITAESLKSWTEVLSDFDKVLDPDTTSNSTPDIIVPVVPTAVPIILEKIEIPKIEENKKEIEIANNNNNNRTTEVKKILPITDPVIEEDNSNLGNSLVASAGSAPIHFKMPVVFKVFWKNIMTFFNLILSFF